MAPATNVLGQGGVQNTQYYYYNYPRSPRYWQRGSYDPWVWQYQRRFLSRQRDFYGSRAFQ